MARRFKKVDGGHGHHGGAWKVAYADFVTAMMALFMVLWLLASTDQASRKEISNYFRSGLVEQVDLSTKGAAQTTSVFIGSQAPAPPMAAPMPTSPGADGGVDERQSMAEDLNKRLHRFAAVDGELAEVMRNVRIQVTNEGVLIEAVDEGKGLLFDSASAKLNEPLERFLRTLGPALSTLGKPVEINGHTDARPFVGGSRISNWDLSYQRASSAREILVASGVGDQQVTGVFARGSSQLFVPGDPLAPQNRRLSILIKLPAKPGAKPAKTGDGTLANAEPDAAN